MAALGFDNFFFVDIWKLFGGLTLGLLLGEALCPRPSPFSFFKSSQVNQSKQSQLNHSGTKAKHGAPELRTG